MRSYAWVELERGLLEFNRGRYEKAMAHYRQADKAYSGYWLVEERMAELLGAERKFDQAVALYKKVVARAPRPEFHQALGDLFLFMGKEDLAKPWHEQALAAYLESAGRGEVQYYHHLAGFYADVREDGAEAVKWARKDAELRLNFITQDGLAWALYRNGQFPAALETMEKALSSGVKDPHLFFHAGMIHLAAGRTGEGKRFLQTVAEINPGYENFHVHR
jgi:tetratricopeptide (TPR) repeat protein